jgi:hypothetical protein
LRGTGLAQRRSRREIQPRPDNEHAADSQAGLDSADDAQALVDEESGFDCGVGAETSRPI